MCALIKRGGGTGPKKPGNRSVLFLEDIGLVPIPAEAFGFWKIRDPAVCLHGPLL